MKRLIRITGVAWTLFDEVRGYHDLPNFENRLDPLANLEKERTARGSEALLKSKIPLLDQCLTVQVIDIMPKLVCTMANFPRSIHHGLIINLFFFFFFLMSFFFVCWLVL